MRIKEILESVGADKNDYNAFRAFFIVNFNLFLLHQKKSNNAQLLENFVHQRQQLDAGIFKLNFYNPPLAHSYVDDLLKARNISLLFQAINTFLDYYVKED